LICVGAALTWSGVAAASGFHTGEYSAALIGQATTGITMTENAAVIATLPAAMVRLPEGSHALGGLTNFDPSFTATPTSTGAGVNTTTDNVLAPHAYYVQNRGAWAWGAGLYFPFNDVIQWPAGWAGRTLLTKEEINVGYLSFSGAYALNDDVSVGGSLLYIKGQATFELDTDLTAFGGPFVPTKLEADDTTFGVNVSVLYDKETWAVGLNHSPKYTLVGDGTLKFDRTGVAAPLLPFIQDQNVTARLFMPSLTELGVSLKDRKEDPNYFVELAVLRTGWSNFSEIRIVNNATGATSKLITKKWTDTTGLKLGGNYVFSRTGDTNHRVRAGLYLDKSPIPADTLAPDVPDGEGRNEIAFGYGFKRGPLAIDASYYLILFKDSTSTHPTLPAKYSGDVAILSASVGYSF
jgi:long-subunit fatty acid transport protein